MILRKSVLAAFTAAAALSAAAADNGFVTVGKTSQPVKIDGQITDGAWQQGISLSPFMINGQNRLALQQTRAKLLWDDQNLYVYFRANATALNPLENRLHDFKVKQKTNDSDAIFKDEAVVLLLTRGEKMYEVVINANGVVTDCISNTHTMWYGRDRKWNSGVKVGTSRFDRNSDAHYIIEAAIPWSSLGGVPQASDNWRFLVGRWSPSAKENSAFQNSGAGVHSMDSLAKLKFTKSAVPQVEPQSFPLLTPGANPWNFKLDGKTPVKLTARVTFEKSAPQRFSASGKKAELTVPLALNKSGEFTFSWKAENPASFSEFIQSPTYKFRVSANLLKHNSKTAKILVNGQNAAKQALLSSGVNTVEIKGKLGSNESVKVGDYDLKFKDNAKNILVLEDTLLWPNWQTEGVTMSANGLQQILFIPRGIKGMTIKDYTMNFDLPEGFEMVCASGYYKFWQVSWNKVGNVKYNGKNYTRYAIKINKPVKFNDKLLKWQWIAVFIKAPAKVQTAEFYYHLASAEKNLQEMPNKIKIKMLPEIKGVQPQNLGIQLWGGWLQSVDDKSVYKYVGESLKNAGITETGALQHTYPGIRHFQLLSFQNWNFSCEDYAKAHPEKRLFNPFVGSHYTKDAYLCSTAIVQDADFKEYFYSRLKAWHKRWYSPNTINWDYESRVFETYLACFCDRCLKEFQKFAKLSSTPTPAEIKKNHAKAWTVYMNQRMADVSGFFHTAIKTLLPGVDYSVYSGYQSEAHKSFYGLDWAMLRDKIGYAACGYSRPYNELVDTRNALKGTPLMLGELLYPHNQNERYAPKFASRAILMRRAADATKGILLYDYATFDARTMDGIAAVSKVMSAYEDIFMRGDRDISLINLRGFDPADYEVLKGADGAMLIILMNPTNAPRKYSFSLKKPVTQGLLNYQTGKRESSSTFSGTIKPNDFVVYVSR